MVKTTQGYTEKNTSLQFINNALIPLCNVMNNLKFTKNEENDQRKEILLSFKIKQVPVRRTF